MIFTQVNEDGENLCDLVLQGRKTVTRRIKPQPVGAVRAVQRGRGKNAIDFVRVVGCEPAGYWMSRLRCAVQMQRLGGVEKKAMELHQFDCEAHREGFKTWRGLQAVLDKTNPHNKPLFRIEFELLPPRRR